MAYFKKIPVVIEAEQWFRNGDNSKDGTEVFKQGEFKGELLEGKVVRYFRHPEVDGRKVCQHCNLTMHIHGWIDTLESGHTVCPGDWIITGVEGERYPCKPHIFEKTYEPEKKEVGPEPNNSELRIVFLVGNNDPYGIRDKSGFLLYFIKIDEYHNQKERYQREIKAQHNLAEFLLKSLKERKGGKHESESRLN